MKRVLATVCVAVLLLTALSPAALARPVVRCSDFPAVPSSDPPLHRIIDEEIDGDLVVEPGLWCWLFRSTVKGDVTGEDGSFVALLDSTVVEGDLRVLPQSTPFSDERSVVQDSVVKGTATYGVSGFNYVVRSEVGGGVEVGLFSWVHLTLAQVGGGVECRDCLFTDVFGSTVDGDVRFRRAGYSSQVEPVDVNEVRLATTEISGDLIIEDSGARLGQPYTVLESVIGGDVRFTRNNAPLQIIGNTVDGSIKVFHNTIPLGIRYVPPDFVEFEYVPSPVISDNVVDGDVEFSHNGGEAATISGNHIDGNLVCRQNQPTPTGEANAVGGVMVAQCQGL